MDRRPVGFFDSGIGGVTAIPHLMRMLPNESIIFFGDTARTPYGSKSEETIRQFSSQIADFLIKNQCKMIVCACNTVTATALNFLRYTYPQVPFIGCISPTAKEVVKLVKRDAHIGIMATRATCQSGTYERKIKEYAPALTVHSIACPALVPLIEEGIIDHAIMDLTLRYYLDDFVDRYAIDTMVLGCTHYPLVAPSIRRLYPTLNLFSSSREVATAVKLELTQRKMLSDDPEPRSTFFASDLSPHFVAMIERILGKDKEELNIGFKNLDI